MPGHGLACRVKIDQPFGGPVGGMEMERAAEFPGGLLSQQPGQELDHELLDTRGSDLPVKGMWWWPAIGRGCVLGIPAMDRDLDGKTPVPPGRTPVPRAGERPCLGAGVGGAKDVKGPVQDGEVPARQLCGILWARVETAPADAFPGCDDGGHPHEDVAHVANQFSGIPLGAVRHRPAPVGPGRGKQGASVIRS